MRRKSLKFPKKIKHISIEEFKKLPRNPFSVKRGKYHNITQKYKGGLYHSKKEAMYAMDLDYLLKAKKIKSWRRQVKIPLECNCVTIGNYYIDFEITHNNGIIEFVEVKGFETDVWKLKWKIFYSIYGKNPNYKLTIVK